MDNERKRQELQFEQKVAEVSYDILITTNIYDFNPVEFAEKVLQFVKEKQEKAT